MDDNVKDSRNAMWEDRFRYLIDSGKIQKMWCRDNGISESTLRYWLRKLRIKPSEKSNTIDRCNGNGIPVLFGDMRRSERTAGKVSINM